VAALIDGMTIHKGLGIKIRSANKGKGNRDPGNGAEDLSVLISVQNRMQLREEWKNVEFLLIDEVSLLSLQLLADIDHALRFAKERPDLWFGGVNVIFAGDFYQYLSVGGSPLYTPISAYARQNDAEIQNRLGRMAWKTVSTVVNLTEQHRMKDDPEYGQAVMCLRSRNCTPEDVDLFNSRVTKSLNNPGGIDMGNDENINATAIVTTNELREVLNARKANSACTGELVMCAAQDKLSCELSDADRTKLLHMNVSSLKSTGTLPGFVVLFEGMPVILRGRNLSTDLGITNGSQGTVRRIFTSISSTGMRYATCVLVEFPLSKVRLTTLPTGYFPILPTTWTFLTLLDVDQPTQKKIRVTRSQLPIQPGFAVTGHASQGKTLTHVLVDMHEGGFAAYVAASRARTRQGLCLTERVSLTQLNKRVSNDLFAESKRFEALEHNSLVNHGFLKGELMNVPDAEGELRLTRCSISVRYSDPSSKDKPTLHKKRAIRSSDPSSLPDPLPCNQRPKKRPRLTIETSEFPVTQALTTIPDLVKSAFGCRWSTNDWSCAYDSVFMALFYVFRGGSLSMQETWLGSNTLLGQLASSFNRLMLSDESMTSADLFDLLRDRMRDSLSAMDPVNFPRHGLHFTSVGRIMDTVFLDNMPILMCVQEEGASSTQGMYHKLNFALPSLCSPVSWISPDSGRITLQDWIMTFIQRETEKLRASNCAGSLPAEVKIVLERLPSILFFEIVSSSSCAIIPSITLVLPSQGVDTTYELCAILYYGTHHFTARVFFLGKTWNYDGRLNGGCPVAYSPALVDTNEEHLSHLDGRVAHILVYVLL
jgi:hypothetical protein